MFIYDPVLVINRTFLDAIGKPVLKLVVSDEGYVAGAQTFVVDAADNLLFIDDHRMIDQDPDAGTQYALFDSAVHSNISAVSPLFDPVLLISRVFLDADGRPILKLAVSAEGFVVGVQTYLIENGDLVAIDDHRMIDQDPDAGTQYAVFDSAVHSNISAVITLFDPVLLISRVFLDAEGRPVVKILINSQGYVNQVLLFVYANRNEVMFIDEHRMLDQDIRTSGFQYATFDPASMSSPFSVRHLYSDALMARCLLDANGTPVLRLMIQSPVASIPPSDVNYVVQVMAFMADVTGNIVLLQWYEMVDQDPIASGMQYALFDPASMTSVTSVRHLYTDTVIATMQPTQEFLSRYTIPTVPESKVLLVLKVLEILKKAESLLRFDFPCAVDPSIHCISQLYFTTEDVLRIKQDASDTIAQALQTTSYDQMRSLLTRINNLLLQIQNMWIEAGSKIVELQDHLNIWSQLYAEVVTRQTEMAILIDQLI